MNRRRMRLTNRSPKHGQKHGPNQDPSTKRRTHVLRSRNRRIPRNLLNTPSHIRNRRGLLRMSNIKSLTSIKRNTQSENRAAMLPPANCYSALELQISAAQQRPAMHP